MRSQIEPAGQVFRPHPIKGTGAKFRKGETIPGERIQLDAHNLAHHEQWTPNDGYVLPLFA
ncbi:MAG: hypothetical protein HYZ18_05115 [Pseudogulbenkiania sp.]|nr:hypothetical protein [Pseudogulbenkiania sp.]